MGGLEKFISTKLWPVAFQTPQELLEDKELELHISSLESFVLPQHLDVIKPGRFKAKGMLISLTPHHLDVIKPGRFKAKGMLI
jgi:hypothetical protein